MNFRSFIEQGTKFSMSGFGAGGRAGQSQATPEKAVTSSPSTNGKIPPSPFNVSSKFQTNTRQFGPLNAGGIKGVDPKGPGVGSLSPAGLGFFKPFPPKQNSITSSKPVRF